MFEPLAGGRYSALTAKIIKEDIFIFDTKIFEQINDGCVHHRGTTDIKFTIFRSGVVFKIFIVQDLMNESRKAIPIIFR